MKVALKTLISRLARRAGYQIIPLWQLKNYELARHLEMVFAQLNISCVLDVGANKGQYGRFLRDEVGYQGTILSFEPIKSNFQVLEQVASDKGNWDTYNYALGNESTRKKINVMKSDVFSSFLSPDHSVVNEFDVINSVEREEVVEIRKLDEVVRSIEMDHDIGRMYVKLDTQGYDLEVIDGGRNTVRHVVALQSEMSLKNIYRGMPTFSKSLQKFNELGFEATGFFPVASDRQNRLIEFDCVMINSATLLVS